MAGCQVLGFDCQECDLCMRCRGNGNEPLLPDGTDLCQNCDHCFDEVVGWSTGIESGSPSAEKARQFVALAWKERDE